MRFEVCRGNVKLGFLTFLDGFSKPPFTQEKGGVFDLDEIWDGEERAALERLTEASSEIPSAIPPARRVSEGGEVGATPSERIYRRGEDREWFGAFLNKLLGEGYEVRQSESQIPS
jgi:hypothetical protein